MDEYTDCMRFSIVINKDNLDYLHHLNNSNFNQQVKSIAVTNKQIIGKKINSYHNNVNDYQNNITLDNIQYSYWYY